MNVLDIIIVLFVLMGIWAGYRRGLIMQAARWAGWVAALFVGYRFSPDVAPLIAEMIPIPDTWEGISVFGMVLGFDQFIYIAAAFLLLFILTRIVIGMVARLLDRVARLPVLNLLNRLLGSGLGLVQVLVISFVVVHVLLYIPWPTGQLWVADSTIAAWLFEHSPLNGRTGGVA